MARLIASGRARVVSPTVRDAYAEADAIRARARDDAARITEAARSEWLAAAESSAVARMLELSAEATEIRESASREVASLALEVASRVVHEAVSVDPALLERIVLSVLSRARSEARVTLTLHPEDEATLVERLAPRGGLPASIRIERAPDQLRGGCIVASERIRIDARVESAILAIARAMGVDPPGR